MRLKEDREAKTTFPEHYEEAGGEHPCKNTGNASSRAGGYYRQCFFMTVNWTIENMMRCFIIRLRKTQRRRQWNWH